MTASVRLDPSLDLPAVAAAAGNSNADDRWYADGFLFVRGVTQEALEAAVRDARPAIPKTIRVVSSLAFMERLTSDERIGIRRAARASEGLEDWLDMLRVAQMVDLDDPRTISGLNAMVNAGLLSSARRDEILR